jgi:hypothetical protein
MAIPAYTTDLILFRDFESAVTLSEFANFISGRVKHLIQIIQFKALQWFLQFRTQLVMHLVR